MPRGVYSRGKEQTKAPSKAKSSQISEVRAAKIQAAKVLDAPIEKLKKEIAAKQADLASLQNAKKSLAPFISISKTVGNLSPFTSLPKISSVKKAVKKVVKKAVKKSAKQPAPGTESAMSGSTNLENLFK